MQSNEPTSVDIVNEVEDTSPKIKYTLSEGLERSPVFRGELTFKAEWSTVKRGRKSIEKDIVRQMKEWLEEREQNKYEVMP